MGVPLGRLESWGCDRRFEDRAEFLAVVVDGNRDGNRGGLGSKIKAGSIA
jgi:hypothetical protein